MVKKTRKCQTMAVEVLGKSPGLPRQYIILHRTPGKATLPSGLGTQVFEPVFSEVLFLVMFLNPYRDVDDHHNPQAASFMMVPIFRTLWQQHTLPFAATKHAQSKTKTCQQQ